MYIDFRCQLIRTLSTPARTALAERIKDMIYDEFGVNSSVQLEDTIHQDVEDVYWSTSEDGVVQTRSEKNGLAYFKTFHEAFAAAQQDETIWKISCDAITRERVRLIRSPENMWIYEPLAFNTNKE